MNTPCAATIVLMTLPFVQAQTDATCTHPRATRPCPDCPWRLSEPQNGGLQGSSSPGTYELIRKFDTVEEMRDGTNSSLEPHISMHFCIRSLCVPSRLAFCAILS